MKLIFEKFEGKIIAHINGVEMFTIIAEDSDFQPVRVKNIPFNLLYYFSSFRSAKAFCSAWIKRELEILTK